MKKQSAISRRDTPAPVAKYGETISFNVSRELADKILGGAPAVDVLLAPPVKSTFIPPFRGEIYVRGKLRGDFRCRMVQVVRQDEILEMLNAVNTGMSIEDALDYADGQDLMFIYMTDIRKL